MQVCASVCKCVRAFVCVCVCARGILKDLFVFILLSIYMYIIYMAYTHRGGRHVYNFLVIIPLTMEINRPQYTHLCVYTLEAHTNYMRIHVHARDLFAVLRKRRFFTGVVDARVGNPSFIRISFHRRTYARIR